MTADLRRARRANRGFTLVEVLVALAVLAFALGAVMFSVSQAAANAVALRDRLQATWIARDRLVELQVTRAWPSPDTTEGKREFGGHEWHWKQKVTVSQQKGLRIVEIEVRLDPEREALGYLLGLLREPPS